MNPDRSPKNPESDTPTSSPERRRVPSSPASPTPEQGPSEEEMPKTGEASGQPAGVPQTVRGRQMFQFIASSCATQSRAPLAHSPSQMQAGYAEAHHSLKRSATEPPDSPGVPTKRQYEPSQPTPRQSSPEPILGRPTIDQFMQRPRGRYRYQQQQLRDFNRAFMERMEQIECHQEEFELEQDVDASQIYFMPAAEEQSDAGGQAGAASGQGVRSPAKREPQPSPGSSPSK